MSLSESSKLSRARKASGLVLTLLSLMYLITYVDRVNIATAASVIQRELSLSNTQLGIVFSSFAYSYVLFQVFGGWVGDRLGARLTLTLCGLIWASATILTGLAGTMTALLVTRVLLGIGEGATFPCATRAMQAWVPAQGRGVAQGITHASARFGNAITPPIVAWLIGLVTWRGSFALLGCCSLLWVAGWARWYRNTPAEYGQDSFASAHNSSVQAAAGGLPWGSLIRRMLPVTVVYFCYAWTLWLYLNWLPSFLLHQYRLDLLRSAWLSSAVFLPGVLGDIVGGAISDTILRRTGDVGRARRRVILLGFLGSFVSMLPFCLSREVKIAVPCLAAAFFFAEMVTGPMWSVPMDIAPKYSGSASGIMNTGSALAAILSPLVFGLVADFTTDWRLSFLGSLALLLLGAGLSFTIRPEIPLQEKAALDSLAGIRAD